MVGGCPEANCHISGPSWSPDGQSVLYVGGGRMYVTDVASRGIRSVTRPAASMPVLWARWTGADQVTFVTTAAGSQHYTVWRAGIDGSAAEAIGDLPLNLRDRHLPDRRPDRLRG